MYWIQLILTRRCNQGCYYCTTHSQGSTIVDIDYLKYVLDELPNYVEIAVELTGGEIGLVDNIEEVYKTVKDHSNVKHVKALSNGLLRKVGIDWLKDIEYWEHLIYEIKGKEIIKFYQDLDFQANHIYVIVTTKATTMSLLNNWKYFENLGLFNDKFFYKLMNHKSNTSINEYFDKLCNLYLKLNNVYFQRMLIHYYAMNRFNLPVYSKKKELCQKHPPNIFVDLQTRKLGHCAVNIRDSVKVEFNKINHRKMMKEGCENDYCQKCYSFDNGKKRNVLRNRNYEQ